MPGTTAEHVVGLEQVTPVAGTPLNVKVVFPATVLKSVPVMVMAEPVVPLLGFIRVIVGKTANVNRFLDGALVMPSTVIVRGTDLSTPPSMKMLDGRAGLVTTQSV